ncbi:site-2 protease family protein [bacterium]|nr:site-2 protease family protein [bacterium]
MSVLLFIIILLLLVLVHEFGHFIVAKKSGIRVDEFGVGFPPKVWSVKRGETEYSVNALPLGGFVKIFGEDPNDESISGPDTSRSFVHKPKYIQAAVLLAGIAFNIIAAWPILTGAYLIGLPSSVEGAPEGAEIEDVALIVTAILPDSPAEKAKLQPGDKILSLSTAGGGGEHLENPSPEKFQEFTQAHEGESIMVTLMRVNKPVEATLTPEKDILKDNPEKAAVGIAMDKIGIVTLPVHLAIIEGGKLAAVLTKETAVALVGFFASIFQGQADFSQVSGPIGIAGVVGDASEMGLSYVLIFTALISINLGLINLLPIPALDGGRILFLLIEIIKGSPMKPKLAGVIHGIFFALLILLILVVTYNDILKLAG